MKLRVLGLDPGTATTGYGVIEMDGNQVTHLDHGCFITLPKTSMPTRLNEIADLLDEVLDQYSPDLVVVEDLFFAKNVSTAITVAQARGVILQRVAKRSIEIKNFTPMQVKQAVTGYGGADKQQIQKMVTMLLGLKEIPKPDDAADALAIALTGATSYSLDQLTK